MKTARMTISRLAGMIKQGFDEMGKDLSTLKNDLVGVKGGLQTLQTGQEDIKLRLDNVPYRFEFVELEKRVDRLEDVSGIGKK